MLMGGPIGCIINDSNVFEWPHNYSWKTPPVLISGLIEITIDAAAEFEWAHNFFQSFQCFMGGPTIALREMQMFTLTRILKIAQDLYHSFINSAQIKYSR
jgi:hypothetical protein